VDPHCSGLGAREADGGAIVIEVRASALFECLGGWIDDAHACEVVCCLAVTHDCQFTDIFYNNRTFILSFGIDHKGLVNYNQARGISQLFFL
jgi:hypothetical protein